MAEPIRFYFDFASPYAWFALGGLRAVAAAHGRTIVHRPVILWAVLQAQGIGDQMGNATRMAYMRADMARSAAFHGVPFRLPEPFRISSHRAARLFHAATANRPDIADDLATALFESHFVRGENIARPETIPAIGAMLGLDSAAVTGMIDGAAGRDGLRRTVEAAVRDGVCGSPFTVVDGEGFFGADRLPQIEWRLAGAGHPGGTS